ncbi:2-phosphosulfolactate phosphatase [Oceanobacillus iheyensis]|uniref:2-phosphosulfolactate phosphatase n=1 Tax=Oceanobacillus iheyensis TaxID=182710 RepID=UPI00363015E5
MGKIHVVLKKEELNRKKLEGKIVVVFDILLATSTITTVLEHGAKEVIPVLHEDEAKREACKVRKENCLLVGEYQGLTLEGFLSPSPSNLIAQVNEKTVILSTTNGTVAMKNAHAANEVYAASLLNSVSVAKEILQYYKNETIILVCSGSSGGFNVEDFYGAGYFIECLEKYSNENLEWMLTDAAMASHQFYLGKDNQAEEVLLNSRVGRKLVEMGHHHDIQYVAEKDTCFVVPYLKDGTYVIHKNLKR